MSQRGHQRHATAGVGPLMCAETIFLCSRAAGRAWRAEGREATWKRRRWGNRGGREGYNSHLKFSSYFFLTCGVVLPN